MFPFTSVKVIGPSIGASTEGYDPDAEDGDEDGKVQDNTPFERAASPAKVVEKVQRTAQTVIDSLPYKPGKITPSEDIDTPEKTVDYHWDVFKGWAPNTHAKLVEHFDEDETKAKEWFATELRDALELLVDDAQKSGFPEIAVWGNILAQILKEGRFKSQFETGRSRGLFDPQMRKSYEEDALGVPADIAPEQRPIYGFMNRGEGDGRVPWEVSQYGNSLIGLRGDQSSRITVTAGDSLTSLSSGVLLEQDLSKLSLPELASIIGSDAHGDLAEIIARSVDDLTGTKRDFPIVEAGVDEFYAELQVHGGVSLEDIEYIQVNWGELLENIEGLQEMLLEANPDFDWSKVPEDRNDFVPQAWRVSKKMKELGIAVHIYDEMTGEFHVL